MDIHTPTDHSADDEDKKPDNNTCKRQRKRHVPADTNKKEVTKQRQAQILKNQKEKERVKAQALGDRDKTDKANRNKPKRPTAQTEDTNNPRPQKSKGKASHPDQIKSSKKGKRKPRTWGNARCQMILHWIQTLKMKIF